MRARASSAVLLGALLVVASAPSPAKACGGCFVPSGTASQVTAHRMALLLSEEQSTLWDQFEYQGEASDFAWVLPVMGTDDVQVELAEDIFFQALVQSTQVQLSGPALSTGGGGGRSGLACGAASADGAAPTMGSPPVQVFAEQTVGPYETVVIGSEDPEALVTWLQDNGYNVGEDLLPVIAHYVERETNFLALRLAPEAGVDRMQPVRVTCPGALTALPLRMIAAGVVDQVSLELFVFADQRYEAGNFPNVEVDHAEIAYDLATDTYNYDALASAALRENAGSVWLTNFAGLSPDLDWVYIIDPEAGTSTRAEADWAHVRTVYERPYLTRLRAALPVNALGVDLVLRPTTAGEVPSFIQVTRTMDSSTGMEMRASDTRMAALPAPLTAAFLLFGGLGVHLVRRWRRDR